MTKIQDWQYGTVHILTQDRQPTGGKAKNMHPGRKPRERSMVATSDCKVYSADGTVRTIPKYTRKPGTPTNRLTEQEKARRAKVRAQERRNRVVDIQNAIDSRKSYSRDFAPISEKYE